MEYTKKINYASPFSEVLEEFDINAPCCGEPNISTRDGYYVCLNCGFIKSKIVAISPGEQSTISDQDPTKTINRVMRHLGPRTYFNATFDGKGNHLNPKYVEQYERLSKMDNRIMNGVERNLTIAHQDFLRLRQALNIPFHVSEDAYRLYLKAAKLKLTHGRTINGLICACFFYALRSHKITRTIEEILNTSQISRKELIRSLKVIQIEILSKNNLKISHLSPENYVDTLTESLDLSIQCGNKAKGIIKNSYVGGIRISGRDPKGYAAAALYIASNLLKEIRTQKQICKVTNISEVTLRKRIIDLQYFQSKGGD